VERHVEGLLLGPNPPSFFLVALQTCGDAQIRIHSRFRTVPRFIEHVIRSFSRSAASEHVLVIKHHPLDRGYADYTDLIRRLARRHGIESRCFYIHDQHLPSLLRKARGVVVINSTVGLSAVGEGMPVKACGDAIYDMEGLTFQGELDSFWNAAGGFRPDMSLWNAFRSYLIDHTQYNGNFYKRLAGIRYHSGVAWTSPGALADAPTIPLPEASMGVRAATGLVPSMRPGNLATHRPLGLAGARSISSTPKSIQLAASATERVEDLATG
jgi:capsular polysaccharide export protein